MPLGRHKNVGRLDIAVDHALGVRRIQRVGHFDAQRQHRLALHWLGANAMFQRLAVEKLHGDERLLTAFADFVNGANVGMIERRRRTRLAAKPFQCLRVSRQFLGQEFEGHEAAKVGVLSFIDHAHAAATEFFDNAVVRDGLADHSGDELVFGSIYLTEAA